MMYSQNRAAASRGGRRRARWSDPRQLSPPFERPTCWPTASTSSLDEMRRRRVEAFGVSTHVAGVIAALAFGDRERRS